MVKFTPKALFFALTLLLPSGIYGQFTVNSSTQVNTHCNGINCQYSGPSILINEIMLSPSSYDGSIWEPNCNLNARCGEWIELYNPDLCESVDISCYYLGNNANDGGNYSGGFVIPSGTIVPPRGFVIIRGQNAPAVPSSLLVQNGGNTLEIIVSNANNAACIGSGGTRIWFPNAGGWFAFYNAAGQPQDAVSWASASNTSYQPCVPSGACGSATSLSSYANIPSNLKTFISSQNASNHFNQTLRRVPDGGAWQISSPSTPTYGTCNSTCVAPATITCNGTATVNVSGGVAPYTYHWNDSQAQTTPTATGLCAGHYCVTITDNIGTSQTVCVDVADHVPNVSFSPLNSLCIDASPINLTGGSPAPGQNETGVYSGTGITNSSFNPATAGLGTFTVTYTFTDTGGCVNTATQPITVNPLPTPSISGLAPIYCLGASAVNAVTIPTGGTLTGNGVSGNSFSPGAAGIGTHTITYNYTDNNGCSNSTSATVDVVSEPNLSITAPNSLCIYENAITLIGTPTGGTFTVNGVNSTSLDPQTAGVGTHTIEYQYQDANGCSGQKQMTIQVFPKPSLSTNLSPIYCIETDQVTITPTPGGGVLSGNGINGNVIHIGTLGTGNHTISYQYTDNNGCENQLSQSFVVLKTKTPSFDTQELCFQSVKFTNTSSQNPDSLTLAWDFDGLGNSTQSSPVFEFSQAGTVNVTLTITDGFGCTAQVTQPVTIHPSVTLGQVQLANVITPNGDSVNDVFGLPSEFDDCLTYRLTIYNRWGNKVYEMTEITEKFKGISNLGSPLNDGVYFYVLDADKIDCKDPAFKKLCNGTITIAK